MRRYIFILSLLLWAAPVFAQLAPLETATAGKVTFYRFLVPHDISAATQTVPIDVSRASAVTIFLSSGTVSTGHLAAATGTVTLQANLIVNATPFNLIPDATGTAVWADAPPAIGGATEVLSSYGVDHYEPGAAAQMRVTINEQNNGLAIQFAIKEEE